ncbi:MAG: RNA polymerase sigma factor [Capsulimonadaceae bacterium]
MGAVADTAAVVLKSRVQTMKRISVFDKRARTPAECSALPDRSRPARVEALDRKPGCEWTTEEMRRQAAWWMLREQERVVWTAALRYLGPLATHEDVEDAWIAFYEDLDRVRQSYRPGWVDFRAYALHVCFKRECIRRGCEIRKRVSAQVPIAVASVIQKVEDDELAGCAEGPHSIVEHRHMVACVERILDSPDFTYQHRRAFALRHFEFWSNEEIAFELGAEIGTVKVWIHRAAQRVRDSLRKEGWTY